MYKLAGISSYRFVKMIFAHFLFYDGRNFTSKYIKHQNLVVLFFVDNEVTGQFNIVRRRIRVVYIFHLQFIRDFQYYFQYYYHAFDITVVTGFNSQNYV